MRNSSLLTTALILAAASVMTSGCTGSATSATIQTPPQPPPPPPHTLAVGASDGTINIFKLPITNTSAPTATIAVSGAQGMAFDASGRLFVASGGVQVFTQPFTSGSGPAFNLAPPVGISWWDAVAFDRAGNLFAGGITPGCRKYCPGHAAISMIPAPITSSSTANFTFTGTERLFGSMSSAASDGSGNLWSTTRSQLLEYTPPFSGSSSPTLSIPFRPSGIAFDSTGNMYLSFRGDGVAVFQPPFSATMTPSFTINALVGGQAAFDTAGNMYVPTSGGLLVYLPPFSGASTPAVTLPGTFSTVTIGP